MRRAGIGLILPNDLDEAIKDIEFIAKAGLRGGVLLPLIPPDCGWLKPLYDPAWDRVYAAIQDHDLVMNQHSGQGSPNYGAGPVAGSAVDFRSDVLLPDRLPPPADERRLREVPEAQVHPDRKSGCALGAGDC